MAPVILSTMMSIAFLPGPAAARPSDMRAAYEDGWKWYMHRKAAGASNDELVDILRTLKRKYGFTYFNMDRVDRALEELTGARTRADRFPAYEVEETGAPAPWVGESEPAEPAARGTGEGVDPFDRYMASQKAILKADAASVGPAPGAVPAFRAAPEGSRPAAGPASFSAEAAAPQDRAAQSRINELSSPDEMTRVRAARALGDMREPGAVGPLIKLFAGESTFVSMAASGALAKIGAPAVKPLLVALQDPNPNVRLGACVALGDMRDPDIGPALEKATQDQDGRVRHAATTALGKIKSAK